MFFLWYLLYFLVFAKQKMVNHRKKKKSAENLEGGTLRGPHFYSVFGRFQTFYMNIWGW